MLKVCMVISTLKKSGPVNVVYNIIKGCIEKDIEFYIVSLSKEPKNNLVEKFLKLNVNYINLNLKRFYSIFKGKNTLYDYLKSNNINTVHLHGFRPNYFGFLIADNFKTITTIHNNYYEDYIIRYGLFLGNIMNFFQQMFLKKIDIIVSVSISNATIISSKINKEVVTIENGIDTSKFKPMENPRKLIRKEFGLKEKELLFISVGHLSDIKNPLFIIDAFKKTKPRGAKLIFLGGGELLNQCRARIDNDDRILLLGRKENVADYLSASDIFISSSNSEGMPNTVMEAISCNNILLLSTIPSHMNILSKGNIGYSFSINNLGSLENIINKVNQYKPEFNSNDIRNVAIENFDLKIMSKKYKNLYFEN